jgi:uncharacterized protein YceH (UPF0502 family)
MMERSPAPLVVKLPRAAGSKEPRYIHLLSGSPENIQVEATPSEASRIDRASQGERLGALETEVAGLRQEVAELRAQLAEFRKQFE